MSAIAIKAVTLLECTFWLAVVSAMLFVLPLKRIIRLLGLQEQTVGNVSFKPAKTASLAKNRKVLAARMDRIGRFIFPHKPCLATALAGHIVLRYRGILTIIYLGVETSRNGALSAHAWLATRDQHVLIGANTLSGYTPVTCFDNKQKE